MLYIQEDSNKFDLNRTIRVSHTGVQRFPRNPAPYTITVVCVTEVRFKFELNLSLTPVANLAFILGTVGEEVYHLRL